MSYTVKSSEKTRKSGAETETKALLYLMNLRKDSEEIYYFIVDFFNDLTGMVLFSTLDEPSIFTLNDTVLA